MTTRLVLTSASPRRKEILATLGFTFDVVVSRVEELRGENERPEDYVLRLAREKALDVARRENAFALGADTIVVLDGDVLEKPANVEHAFEMIRKLAGRTHEVHTAIALADASGVVGASRTTTRVEFRSVSDDVVRRYAESGEGLDKAGAYAVQGVGAGLVSRIEGSYTNVVRLPASEVVELLVAHEVVPRWPT